MGIVTTDSAHYAAIAAAIRERTGSTETYKPSEMAAAIAALPFRDWTWEDVRDAVCQGFGPALYPVGYEFVTHDADTGQDIVWVVRAHDHHQAADETLTHTMTLETKYVYSAASGTQKTMQYDAKEALYYAESGLAAGAYHFTVANQEWYQADNGKSYQFTLTKAVPAGGQVVVSITPKESLEGKTVMTYPGSSPANSIEAVTLTEGSAGTSLGTTDGTGNMNHFTRAAYGSNNYAQSAVRQWLNSAERTAAVRSLTNKFDRPISGAVIYSDFMHGLPADFLAVVQPAMIPCITNSVCETKSRNGTEFATDTVYTLQDKFFLLSQPEIFGTWDSETCKDGEQLEYYKGLTDAGRIKYDVEGTARLAWTRSPNPIYAYGQRIVHNDGSLYNRAGSSSGGVAPACIIA